MRTSRTHLLPSALLLAAALAAPGARAQDEGYDPMRQITAQLQKANLQIVLDVTGSMAWFPEGKVTPETGVNSFGWLRWSRDQAGDSWGPEGSGCSSDKCYTWRYKLAFNGPSRMAVVKNALGATVPLVTTYTPPADLPARWTLESTASSTASRREWVYRYDSPSRVKAPGIPFTPYETITIAGARNSSGGDYTVTYFPIVRDGACTVGTCTYSPPQDLIGKNAARVNWGLTTFSTDGITHRVDIDVTDANEDLAELKDYFLPAGATGRATGVGGLGASGGTNTNTALSRVKTKITAIAGLDPRIRENCDRPYGVILVTDGLSNNSNPDDGNWINPCGTGPLECDGGSSGYDCPNNWDKFAAKWANELYTNTSAGGVQVPVRTWTIGVSEQVGPCELDYIAFMGRTDASSPNGDAGWGGFDPVKNPFLPDPASPEPANPRYNTTSNFDGPSGQLRWNQDSSVTYAKALAGYGNPVKKAHGHNAFFATSAEKLGEALMAIVNATATGDYATNAPVSGMSAGGSLASIVYLPSTEFPSWKGHIYAFDTSKPAKIDHDNNPATPMIDNPAYLKWDAGVVLNPSTAHATRKIFTWDPANGNALVELKSDNLGRLNDADMGGISFDAAVLDFVRGVPSDFDGDGVTDSRDWLLGPMINSAPALVGRPAAWLQGKTVSHSNFESAYASREPLLWVGSNNGMMHGFRIEDGVEQIALVPPALLKMQVQLFENYLADQRLKKNPFGQPPDPAQHVYGVANSFRFGDVWDPDNSTYRTVGVITVGAAGDDVVAVDVTSVPSPTAATYPTDPVKVLWAKDSTTITGLKQTWSIPAMAPATSTAWRMVLGGGFNPSNTRAAQISGTGFTAPKAFSLDPTDGSLLGTITLTSSTYTPWVGNQAFADSVIFDPSAKVYQDDNIAKLGLQADLNGQIWFLYNQPSNKDDFATARVGIDVSAKAGQSQPIYYNPAASGYGAGGAGCVAYAFGSGALYEKSTLVTGPNVGTTGNFIPQLYVATGAKGSFTSALSAGNIVGKPIATSWCIANCDDPDPTTHVYRTFGTKTQLTAPPFMLVPRSGRGNVTALYLLYDPEYGCHGNSYIAIIDFAGNDTCSLGSSDVTFKAVDAGEGAASGFTIAGSKVLVSKSGIGQGERAHLTSPPDIAASIGGPAPPRVKWWKELK